MTGFLVLLVLVVLVAVLGSVVLLDGGWMLAELKRRRRARKRKGLVV